LGDLCRHDGVLIDGFHLKPEDKMTLFDNGHTTASQFLSAWNYDKWRAANPAQLPAATRDRALRRRKVTT
jgi:hypothetical protein